MCGTPIGTIRRVQNVTHQSTLKWVYTQRVRNVRGDQMQTVNVRETRQRLSHLLDAVAAGEEIMIMRNGEPAAVLVAPSAGSVVFEDHSALRAELPPMIGTAAESVRQLRDEERF